MELSEITEAMRPIAAQYWQTVRNIAEEAHELGNEDEVDDFIHNAVDGSEWVIYTYAAQAVLLITDNQDVYTDEYGNLSDIARTMEVGSDLWCVLAFYAMRQDVQDHLSALESTESE